MERALGDQFQVLFISLRFSVMETFSPLLPPVTPFFTCKLARISHQTGRLFLNIFKIEMGVGGRVGVVKVVRDGKGLLFLKYHRFPCPLETLSYYPLSQGL